jgi:hypothetical protein
MIFFLFLGHPAMTRLRLRGAGAPLLLTLHHRAGNATRFLLIAVRLARRQLASAASITLAIQVTIQAAGCKKKRCRTALPRIRCG